MFENPISISGKIETGKFYENFTERFSELMRSTKSRDPVTIYINSSGGDTDTTLGFYDLIRNCGRKTVAIVAGKAYSGASLILQAAEKRVITPHSCLMIHRSFISGLGGYVDSAQAAVDTYRKIDNHFFKIYADRSGKSVKEIVSLARRDKYFDAKEALEYGLADECFPIHSY